MSTSNRIDLICLIGIVAAAFLTIIVMVCGAASGASAAEGTTMKYESTLFDTSKVHTIDIEIDDWEGFLDTCENEEYTCVDVTIDDKTVQAVGLRAKGNTSLSSVSQMGSDRYSFKIEFDQYNSGGNYDGLDKLSLNNCIQDTTYMKDYLTYTMMADFGVDAPLCSYAYITVNGEDWGLYLAVEGVEDSYLERTHSSEGELYKPESLNMGGGRGNGMDFDMGNFLDEDGNFDESLFNQGGGRGGAGDASGAGVMPNGNAGDSAGAMGGDMPNAGGNTGDDANGNAGGSAGVMPNAGGGAGVMPNRNAGGNTGGTMPNGDSLPDMSNMPDMSDMSGNAGNTNDAGESAGNNAGNGAGAVPNMGDNAGGANTSGMPEMPNADGSGMPDMSEMPTADGMPEAGGFPNMDDAAGAPNQGGGMDMGSDDVKLKYIDDDASSYSNIFDNAKTDITKADKSRLIASLKNLSSGTDIESTVNVDQVIRYFVVHNFVVNADSYTGSMVHNYYLYENDGQLSMIPWDYNLAFGTFQGNNATTMVNDAIDSPLSADGTGDRPMFDFIVQNDTYLQRYHQYLAQFIKTDYAALITQTAALIAPYVEKDPTAFYGYEDFQTGVQTLVTFCNLRAQSIQAQLDGTIATTDAARTDSTSLIDASSINLNTLGTMGNGGNAGNMGAGGNIPSEISNGNAGNFP